MRLFLDASVSPAIRDELAQLGFDVMAQRDVLSPKATDTDVMDAAWKDQRVVVARDYDTAELVLRGFAKASAVVVVAFDAPTAKQEAQRIAEELHQLGERLTSSVLVIEPSRVRRRPFDLA